jgi:hypothetical protein
MAADNVAGNFMRGWLDGWLVDCRVRAAWVLWAVLTWLAGYVDVDSSACNEADARLPGQEPHQRKPVQQDPAEVQESSTMPQLAAGESLC